MPKLCSHAHLQDKQTFRPKLVREYYKGKCNWLSMGWGRLIKYHEFYKVDIRYRIADIY